MSEKDRLKRFKAMGSNSVKNIIAVVFPSFAKETASVQELPPDGLPAQAPASRAPSNIRLRDGVASILVFTAKLAIALIVAMALIAQSPLSDPPRFALQAKHFVVGSITGSLYSQGLVYVFLTTPANFDYAVQLARYFERRGDVLAALRTWEAAAEALRHRVTPIDEAAIEDNIARNRERYYDGAEQKPETREPRKNK